MRHLFFCAAPLIALGAGCDAPEGVLVHLTLPAEQQIDRLRVSGVADDDEAFEPAFFPEPPRTLEAEGETLTILVDEELIGEDLVLSFEAMRGSDVRVTGNGTIDVSRDRLVDLDVDLSGGGGRAAATSTNALVVDGNGEADLPTEAAGEEPDNDRHDDDDDLCGGRGGQERELPCP